MSNDNCNLISYIKGECDSAESERLAQEIEGSSELKLELDQFREIDQLLGEYSHKEINLKRDLSSEIISSIKQSKRSESVGVMYFFIELVKNPRAVLASIAAAFVISFSIGHVMLETVPTALTSSGGHLYYAPLTNSNYQTERNLAGRTATTVNRSRGIFSLIGAFAIIAGASIIAAARSRNKTLAFVGFSALLVTALSFILKFFLIWYFAAIISGRF